MGFFELAEGIWAEADRKRDALKADLGAEFGNWLADIRQYGAAWMGDVWEWTAIGAENHMAFATIPAVHPWDYGHLEWGGWRKPHHPEANQEFPIIWTVIENGVRTQKIGGDQPFYTLGNGK